jgi:hypothetical protein
MIIISHRGYWKNSAEKNTIKAFRRSFKFGFGTETDIRDYNGELVISHDIPNGDNITFENFLEIYKELNDSLPLALNIKSDGLQHKIKNLLDKFNIENYFLFDMSVPDGILYIKENLITYTRQSEYENPPAYYQFAYGVWLDQFNYDWLTEEVIKNHFNNNKKICLVSPELHNRDYREYWIKLKEIGSAVDISKIMLCTDHPEEARVYFNDQN